MGPNLSGGRALMQNLDLNFQVDLDGDDDDEDEDETIYPSGKPECKKFMHGIPDYIDYLAEMYQGTAVDEQSSCIPGHGIEDEDNELPDDDQVPPAQKDLGDDEHLVGDTSNSPMSTGSRKRGSSTTDTATSPNKKGESPMISVFKGLIHTLQTGSKEEAKTLDQIYNKRIGKKARRREQEMNLRFLLLIHYADEVSFVGTNESDVEEPDDEDEEIEHSAARKNQMSSTARQRERGQQLGKAGEDTDSIDFVRVAPIFLDANTTMMYMALFSMNSLKRAKARALISINSSQPVDHVKEIDPIDGRNYIGK
ncbi:uncharacterized protein C2845_PM08G11150 [Panicum miliaceum]|uniref:Uncharacterized protein n=1 Tax=Panicum miliaceum TaxID=4540 RepID=A0A3L6QXZ6_PANMI|nr:uncharacterized protein C2845_PM08G11150 [Panicum miliaceum]